jgi:hypothetical protein
MSGRNEDFIKQLSILRRYLYTYLIRIISTIHGIHTNFTFIQSTYFIPTCVVRKVPYNQRYHSFVDKSHQYEENFSPQES